MITHSAKETGQQKEQRGWRFEMTGKCVCVVRGGGGGGGGNNLKKGYWLGNIGGSS